MVEYINEKVVLLPQHKHFFKDVDKKDLSDLITYIYYYYHPESTYAETLLSERIELCLERINNKEVVVKYKDLLSKYENTILTPIKRLAIAHLKKIEEIIQVFYRTEVTFDNIEEQSKMMKSVTELYKLSSVIEEKIAKESSNKQGKGSKQVNEYETITF